MSKKKSIAIVIIIAVVLIALIIFNSTGMKEKVIDGIGTMGAKEYNAQFAEYLGKDKEKQQINELFKKADNINFENDDHKIRINYNGKELYMVDVQGFQTKDRFTVTAKDTDHDQYYDTILVTKQ